VQFGGAYLGGDHPEPSPEQVQAWHRRLGLPDNELPGAIPFHAVLAKTDDLVLAVVSADAYSTGMSIRIAIRVRRHRCTGSTSPIRPGRRLVAHGRCLPRWSNRQHRGQPTLQRSGDARGRAFAHGSWRRRGWPHLRDELLADTHAFVRRPDDHRRLANSGHPRNTHGDSARCHCPGCLRQPRTLALAATPERRTPTATQASSARGRLVRPARDRQSVRG
jgi:hypothetical protein